MKKDVRQKMILRRKNLLPGLIVSFLLWICLGLLVYFTDPNSGINMFLFFALITLATLFTFSLILGNRRKGILIAVVVTVFLLLRYFGIGNILNLLLLISLAGVIEIYARLKK